MALEEVFRAIEVFGAQDAGIVLEKLAAKAAAQVEAHLVAGKGGHRGHDKEQPGVDVEFVAQDGRGYEQ